MPVPRPLIPRLRGLIVPALLAGVIFLYFLPALRSGHTLVPLDIATEFDLLFAPGRPSHNYLLSDLLLLFYPNYAYLWRTLAAGGFPFWNPHVGAGVPFFADSQTQVLEFTHLLAYPLEITPLAFPLFSAIVTLWLGSLFSYGYFRNLRYAKPVAAWGALAFTFSGPLIVWLNYPTASTIIWLPLILLCLDRLIRDRDQRFGAIGAVAVAFLLFAGQPQTASLALLVSLWYAGCRVARLPRRNRWQGGRHVALMLCLGMLLSAIQTLPTLDLVRESEAYRVGRGYRAQTSLIAVARDQLTHLKSSLATLGQRTAEAGILAFRPHRFGSPVDRNYRHPSGSPYANFAEVTIYVGLLTALLALVALRWYRHPLVSTWAPVAGLSFAAAADLPFAKLISYLPVLDRVSPSRWRPLLGFALVALAAASVERIWRASTQRVEQHRRWLPHLLVWLLTAVTLADLWGAFRSYHTHLPSTDAFLRDHPAVAWLQRQNPAERAVGIGTPGAGFRAPLIPNLSLAVGINDIRGYNPLTPRDYAQFADAFLVRRGSFTLADAALDERLINLMGVRYLICPTGSCPGEGASAAWPLAYADDAVRVLQHPAALPRSWVAYDYALSRDLAASLAELRKPSFDPRVRVTLQETSPANLPPPRLTAKLQPAAITDYQPNRVRIEAAADHPGVLVLTDRYDRGWRATVNGETAPILRANAIFRAVAIPSGKTTVIFTYRPPTLRLALAGTAAGAILLLAWAWRASRLHRRSITITQA